MTEDKSNTGGTASTPSESWGDGRGETRPSRKHPAHPPVVEPFSRSVIVYVTVCTKDRHPVLANAFLYELLRHAWEDADRWHVGRYVVMPDHVQLFCSISRNMGSQVAKVKGMPPAEGMTEIEFHGYFAWRDGFHPVR